MGEAWQDLFARGAYTSEFFATRAELDDAVTDIAAVVRQQNAAEILLVAGDSLESAGQSSVLLS